MAIWGDKKAIPAIMRASGITKEQARTCLYYVIATYFLPDDIDIMPILLIVGPQGTGKTELLKQLYTMANNPKIIAAESIPTLRDNLTSTTTAIIDEGDNIHEQYLIQRYDKETSTITYKKNLGGSYWRTIKANIFGATIIARRTPFRDAATTSRSITIRTFYNPGNYRITRFRKASDKLSNIASRINLEEKTSERIRNNWMPLRAIAQYFKDKEWLEYSNQETKKYTRVLVGSHKLEPEQALLLVLRENMTMLISGTEHVITGDVKVSNVRHELRSEFDCQLSNTQIEEIASALGFRVVTHSGYPKIKCEQELLERLLEERGLKRII